MLHCNQAGVSSPLDAEPVLPQPVLHLLGTGQAYVGSSRAQGERSLTWDGKLRQRVRVVQTTSIHILFRLGPSLFPLNLGGFVTHL